MGSTEPHYTPSKAYQGVLSGKPIIAVLHELSTAVDAIRLTNSGMVLSFNGEMGVDNIRTSFASFFKTYCSFMRSFQRGNVNTALLNEYSAKEVTKKLSILLSDVIK